jgi:hypothetical protein
VELVPFPNPLVPATHESTTSLLKRNVISTDGIFSEAQHHVNQLHLGPN